MPVSYPPCLEPEVQGPRVYTINWLLKPTVQAVLIHPSSTGSVSVEPKSGRSDLLDFLTSQSPMLSRSSIICRDGRWLPIFTSKPWWPMTCPWSAYSETQQILDISWEQETWWISTLPLTGRFRKDSEPNARHIPTVSLTSISSNECLLTTIPQFRTFSHRELLQHHSVWSRWRNN